MINLTNDAWFGLTPGPYQHLAQARVRTIEEGLPMIRAANNGISAVIDPVRPDPCLLAARLGGRARRSLPERLNSTGFSRYGNDFGL